MIDLHLINLRRELLDFFAGIITQNFDLVLKIINLLSQLNDSGIVFFFPYLRNFLNLLDSFIQIFNIFLARI